MNVLDKLGKMVVLEAYQPHLDNTDQKNFGGWEMLLDYKIVEHGISLDMFGSNCRV